jgi:hypothetical protein
MRRIRHAAAVGVAVTMLSLCFAPTAAAVPRTEDAVWSPLLVIQGFADHVADLFGGWVRSLFAPTGGEGDPNG